MKLKNLVNKSYYCTVGYIDSNEKLELTEQYIVSNLEVLHKFKGHIIVTNYSGDFQSQNKLLWEKYLPECILIDLDVNRGHSFGIADQENAIVDYCKSNNINWICKTSHDVLLTTDMLKVEVEPYNDFYYMNSIGLGGMEKYNYDLNRIIAEDYYPSTNFYFLNTSKIDYLYDKEYVNKTYEYIQTIKDYNGKVWEYIEGWTCEDFLKWCTIRNKLRKYHLVPKEKYRTLLIMIHRHNVTDCSLPNLLVEGICHFADPNNPVLKI